MSRQPHVLVIPYPAQGHITPLVKLASKIAEHGVKVTFVSTEYAQAKFMASMPKKAYDNQRSSLIRLVPIPDGIEQEEDRKDPLKTRDSMLRVMPGCLKDLIQEINQSNNAEKISCVIADTSVGWALEVAQKMGIAKAAVIPYGPAGLALSLHIPKLREAGILDAYGNTMNDDELILLSDRILPWKRNQYPWSFPSEQNIQKIFFGYSTNVLQTLKISNWVICNSCYGLDSATCDLIPNLLTIGPLPASNHSDSEHFALNFWPEDTTCLSWLDKQPLNSVIYVAFGSTAVLSQLQFDELALGLESLNRPFLWVVRSNLMDTSHANFPDGFTERVSDRGKIVEWAPQEKVLAHSSVACFVSHCGWNSTMEGLIMGVPFLCWPYCWDQYQNRNYICEAWKIGLELSPDKNGIITREEIQRKAKMVLDDDSIEANSLQMKEMARKGLVEGGSSFKNFETFISQIKALR